MFGVRCERGRCTSTCAGDRRLAGTTIRAIRVLSGEGVRAAFLGAIQAAMERSQELAAGGQWRSSSTSRPTRRTRPRAARTRSWPPRATSSSPAERAPSARARGRATAGLERHRAGGATSTACPRPRVVELRDGEARCSTGCASPAAVHRIQGELGDERAADLYDRELEGVALDLVLNGLGPDGHFASLYPRRPTLRIRDRARSPPSRSSSPSSTV